MSNNLAKFYAEFLAAYIDGKTQTKYEDHAVTVPRRSCKKCHGRGYMGISVRLVKTDTKREWERIARVTCDCMKIRRTASQRDIDAFKAECEVIA